MAKKYSTGPKRRIERIKSVIIDTAVSDSLERFDLHTCEDAKTLIRAMGFLSISPIDTAMATTVLFSGGLYLAPNSVNVDGASVTQSLDDPVSLQEIGAWYADAMQNDTNGILVTDKIHFDVSAQRKLKEGDVVTLYHTILIYLSP